MNVSFAVTGVPPKKDGANSMWGKSAEVLRLKALRLAAYKAFNGAKPLARPVRLGIRVYAEVSAGDLDNFITGICDGFMAADPRSRINESAWLDVPEAIRPSHSIAYDDDSWVCGIAVERLPPDSQGTRYEVTLAWDE